MDTLKSVLQEVKDGRQHFDPVSNTEGDKRDFQPIAKMLVHANSEGLLDSFSAFKDEAEGPYDWYTTVSVLGGLSHKGEMFLAAPASGDGDKQLAEAVLLKPNLYGVGVDLKVLWARWRARKRAP